MTPAGHVVVAPVSTLPEPGDARWRDLLEPAELAYCTGFRRVGEHLAARAVGRQAVLAALGLPAASWWHDLSIRREPSGRPTVVLSDRLARWRESRGVAVPGVSLSHAAGHAAALAWLPGAGSPSRLSPPGQDGSPRSGDPA